jgi:hypothetical protein
MSNNQLGMSVTTLTLHSITQICSVARCICPDGKPALTRFKVLAAASATDLTSGSAGQCAAPGVAAYVNPSNNTAGAALVLCEPLTGRTHQIRVHLAHAGNPILGDDLYGVTGPWIERQALHAAALQCRHPGKSEKLSIVSPLPGDFAGALRAVGLEEWAEGDRVERCVRA